MKKKIWAVLLSICMIISILPITVAAADAVTVESSINRIGETGIFQGLSITCAEGDLAGHVKLINASNTGASRQSISIEKDGTYTISGTWDTSLWDGYANVGAVLVVQEGVNADITLENVTIRPDQANNNPAQRDSSGIRCMDNSQVILRLVGENEIYGRSNPAIELRNTADVTITGDGQLTAVAGKGTNGRDGRNAGIGCMATFGGGTLTINGGTIRATGDLGTTNSPGGAGIGDDGTSSSSLSSIVIEEKDGYKIDLTAQGGKGAPGIGTKSNSSLTNMSIEIRSGKVTAIAGEKNSYYGCAGIGGGHDDMNSGKDVGAPNITISISGGEIIATGVASGAGIGGGYKTSPNIIIEGGNITATGGSWAPGIGAGYSAKSEGKTLQLTGGTIQAVGTSGGAGIGGGLYGQAPEISLGGDVEITAIGSGQGDGIGAGQMGAAQAIVISDTADITALASNGMAINAIATVTGRSLLNVRFVDEMPNTLYLVNEAGNKTTLSGIPSGMRSFADTFENGAQTLKIQNGESGQEKQFAYYMENSVENYTYSMAADTVLTKDELRWGEPAPTTYTITAKGGEHGTISPAGEQKVVEGEDITFTFLPDKGYEVKDVKVDGVSVGVKDEYTFTDVNASHSIEVVFGAKEYTISYEMDGGTNPADNPTSYNVEQDIVLKDPSKSGYQFTGWTYEGQTTPQKNLTLPAGSVSGNLTFTAHWEKNSVVTQSYALHYETNGGEDLPHESKTSHWVKAYEELPVPEKTGYIFAGWHEDEELTKLVEDDVIVNRTKITLYAKWEKDEGHPEHTGVSDVLNTEDHMAYLEGYPGSKFMPEGQMTRAEVAQMFYNLLLDKQVETTVAFEDVADNAWYADAIHALASMGILEGREGNKFDPDTPITRAEFATIAVRFASQKPEGEVFFQDVSKDAWYYSYVTQCAAFGWIEGYEDDTFRPDENIRRGEAATIVNRMLGRQADEEYIDSHSQELASFVDLSQDHWAYYHIMEATNSHDYEKKNGQESWTGLKD